MRVLIPKDIQRKLLFTAKSNFNYTWRQLSQYLGVSDKSLENWYRCERLLPETIFLKIKAISGISIQDFKVLPDNWGQVKGGENSIKLNGGSFWTLKGSRKGGTNSARKFPLPSYSESLAEFIGIMLGDGGISRGQISITLGYSTDYGYVPYIRQLIKELFKSDIHTYCPSKKDVIRINISGVNLVRNLCKLGLVQGDKVKHQIDIPRWIFKNDFYKRACIRGLIDTDGCVHRKTRREKNRDEYRSIGVYFKTASFPLQRSLAKLFNDLGFHVAISGGSLYLCGQEQIKRYVGEIGFSNPKHLNRYQKFLQEYGWKKFRFENCLKTLPTI